MDYLHVIKLCATIGRDVKGVRFSHVYNPKRVGMEWKDWYIITLF